MKKLTKKQQDYYNNTGSNPVEEKSYGINYYNKRIQIEKNHLANMINFLKLPYNEFYEMCKRTEWDLKSICFEIRQIRNSITEYRKAKAVYINGTFWKNVKESA